MLRVVAAEGSRVLGPKRLLRGALHPHRRAVAVATMHLPPRAVAAAVAALQLHLRAVAAAALHLQLKAAVAAAATGGGN